MSEQSNSMNSNAQSKSFTGTIAGWIGMVQRPNFKVGNMYVTDIPVAHNYSQWDSTKKANVDHTIWVTVKIWSDSPLPKKDIDMATGKGGYINAQGPISTQTFVRKNGEPGFSIILTAHAHALSVHEGGNSFGTVTSKKHSVKEMEQIAAA